MQGIMEKLKILADSAKYDVSCSSSGAGRRNDGRIGSAHAAGICHTWGADGRCISLLKVLFTNKCVYDCEYCINRRTNDFPRASFEPDELARLTIEFYRRNYIEGLFLSSAVEVSPDHTAERILESLEILRYRYGFAGYIHAKIIPGVSSAILHRIGLAADRLSVNIEMPTSRSLEMFAPQKKAKQIFAPMRQITNSLIERNALMGPGTMFKGQQLNTAENYLGDPAGRSTEVPDLSAVKVLGSSTGKASHGSTVKTAGNRSGKNGSRGGSFDMPAQAADGRYAVPSARHGRSDHTFAPAGQTTQMIIGAGGETDQSILTTSENLYRAFKMKRVYYSAYIPVVDSPILPDRQTAPPLAREHRIDQADWLLRFYGFTVSELFNEENANLDPDLDPKVTWALRNLEKFPVEINRASYEMLMRIPGIGSVSARRIIRQRKLAPVKFDDLKKMGVVMKRAKYFLTCSGRYYGERRFEQETIRNSILQMENGLQLSMFDNSWNRLEEGARQEKLASAGVI